MRRALLLGLLGLAGCGGGDAAPLPPAPRGVLLAILDTTRADHLSGAGYGRATTPELDRLAAEGVRYEQAWSPSPWTLPAVATLLTGQPPWVHGAGRSPEGMFALRPEVATLAERLGPRGVRSAAFINVVWCHPDSGLARGFDPYDYRGSDESNTGHRDAAATTDAALAWAAGLSGAPFFLVVHYFDPHLVYRAPEPWYARWEPAGSSVLAPEFGSKDQVFAVRDGRIELSEAQRATLVARYDGELAFADEQLGRLRAGLERLGLWDDTLVIVAGDHGEEFWDHGGFEHGHSHHRELLRVPLIVRRPRDASAGTVSPARVRLLDVGPTVLDWHGVSVKPPLPGGVLGAAGPGAAPPAVAQGSLWAGDLVSVRTDAGTLIVDRDAGSALFYAPDDPLELEPLPPEAAPAELRALADAVPLPRQRDAEAWEPTPEQLERLRSLGYLR